MFSFACIPNAGSLDKLRVWAGEHRLNEIHDAPPLSVFVGPGNDGAAWAMPTSIGNFAVSQRGTTKACAVYAQYADPADVLGFFKQMITGVSRPGLSVSLVNDETSETPQGARHLTAYTVRVTGQTSGKMFIAVTFEKKGGAFQASMSEGNFSDNGR